MDDNPADIDLIREILGSCKCHYNFSPLSDAEEAISFLHRRAKHSEAPDLVIPDFNLPRKDSRTVTKERNSGSLFCKIPIPVFTTSQAGSDIESSHQLGAIRHLRERECSTRIARSCGRWRITGLVSRLCRNRRTHVPSF